jgi:hypothetical protein
MMKHIAEEKKRSFPHVTEQPVTWGKDYLRSADHYKAVVDSETQTVFSIVTTSYRLIRHEEAIGEIERAITKASMFGSYEISTSFSPDGGRMRRTYRFPEISVRISGGDIVNPELHLLNSYDGTWPLMVILGAFRLVCKNGLVVQDTFLCFRKRHIVQLDQIYLEEEVSTALRRFELQTEQWKRWLAYQLTPKTYGRVMKAMRFGKKARQGIEHRIVQEAEDVDQNHFPIISIWLFYNILTWHITHRAVSLNHRVAMENRLRAALAYFR